MKAFRTWSEISYGLSETSHGASPNTRRVYKARLSRVRREMDKKAIADSVAQSTPIPKRQWGEWDPDFIDDPCTKDQEIECMWMEYKGINAALDALAKEIQCDIMWHNHTL